MTVSKLLLALLGSNASRRDAARERFAEVGVLGSGCGFERDEGVGQQQRGGELSRMLVRWDREGDDIDSASASARCSSNIQCTILTNMHDPMIVVGVSFTRISQARIYD